MSAPEPLEPPTPNLPVKRGATSGGFVKGDPRINRVRTPGSGRKPELLRLLCREVFRKHGIPKLDILAKGELVTTSVITRTSKKGKVSVKAVDVKRRPRVTETLRAIETLARCGGVLRDELEVRNQTLEDFLRQLSSRMGADGLPEDREP